MTYYSWHDNGYLANNHQPSYDIAYSREKYPRLIYTNAADRRGGDGSSKFPIIVAVSPTYEGELPTGTRIYAPHLKKYLIVQDQCQTPYCEKKQGGLLIDVWMYTKPTSDKSKVSKVEECQRKWTGKGFEQAWDVVINPPNDKPVDTAPFFNPDTNECRTPNFN
jgi:hypothetical protein